MNHDSIHIAVAFDQNYSRLFYVMAESLFTHHKNDRLTLHAIINGVGKDELVRIREFVENPQHEIIFYTVDNELASRFVLNAGRSMAAYYRLFFPFLISPDVTSRILYLDVDTVVVNNLRAFFSLSLQEYPVAAVYDVYVKRQPLLGIMEEGEYFNSGVMLMDLERWRGLKISEQTIDYVLQYPERILYVDQCGLNAVLIGRWKKLPVEYNLMYSWLPEGLGKRALQKMLKNVYVVHYTLERPWSMLCKNRLRYLYSYYFNKSRKLQKGRRITDFSYSKIPAWVRIRLVELYFDLPVVSRLWRGLKRVFQRPTSQRKSALQILI